MGGPLPGRPRPRSPRTFVGPGAPTPWRPPEVGGALGHLLAPSTGPDVCSRPPGPWFPPRASGRRGRCPLPLRSSRKSPPGPLATPTPSTARLAWPGRAGDSRGRRPGGAVRAGGAAAGRPCRPSAARQARVGWFWEGGAPGPGAPGRWWDSNTRPPVSGLGELGESPGEKPGPRLLSNGGPRGGANQTCRAGLRASLGEGAAPAPSARPPPPRGSETKAECLLRGCADNGPGILPLRWEGPLQPQLPSPQSGSCASAGTGGVCPGCRPRQCLPPNSRRDPFWEGPGGSWKSWERGLCVSAHLGHPFLSTSLIIFVALTVYQTL